MSVSKKFLDKNRRTYRVAHFMLINFYRRDNSFAEKDTQSLEIIAEYGLGLLSAIALS